MFSQKSLGAKFRAEGYTPKKPVLIIPGLCSSCLKVVESPHNDWIGKRIWLSMSSIGFDKMWDPIGFGRKKKKGEETKMAEVDAGLKRKWISHMVLQPDGISDPEGIKLRPVKGLKGCAYLDPGAITNALSYVFGPFIETLEDAGYIDEVNLNAVPYDWRLPPHRLEERDGYFSDVQRIIEKMVRENGAKVAVICHSLGNRVMHYFVRFMEKKAGRQWVTDHVDCWIALGPLWLGAPKLLRAIVTGDRMGLDAFLFPEEGIALGRSLGSSAWMFPYVTHENEFSSYCQLKNKKSKKFEPKSNQDILIEGGAEIVWKKYSDYYHNHHLVGPPDEVFKAPPIDKLYAIYGINLKTEAYYFFKQAKTKNSATPLQLDTQGSVPNLKCEGGIGFETKNTRQNVLKGKPRAGDGTVPYASLSYCKKWAKEIQVKVVEIEGAEHREILKNKTMITLVLEYVMQAPPPSVLPSNFTEISYEVNIQAKHKLCPRLLFLGRENMCTLSKSGSKTKSKHFYENITDVRLQTDGKGFIIEFENCPPYAFKASNSETIVSDIAVRCRFIQDAKKTYTEDRNDFGQTALHIAAVDNSIDDIIALLKSGSDVNAVDNNGWTPLITAADKGNLETILCLLQTNDIDIGRQSINGSESVVHKLAAVTMQDDEGYKRKWCSVMKVLKTKGANLNEKNEFGEFPIHLAVKRGNIIAVTWLGENGANINAVNNMGETPLHYAIRSKNEDIMLRLCSMGANKHAETNTGESPLNMSRKISPELFSKLQNNNSVHRLSATPPNTNLNNVSVDEYGQTPLHRAAFEDRLDDVFEIISKDVTSINVQDKNGWTPLHSAASNGNLEVVVVLLNMPSADISISTHNDTTILHYLIRKKFEGPKLHSYIDTLNRMKEKGCVIDAQASKGITPLHEACIKNNVSGIEWLLNNGADPNIPTTSGDSALHFAVRSTSKEAILILLKFGANPNAVSQYDGTPAELAKSIAPQLIEVLNTPQRVGGPPRKPALPQKKNIFRASTINPNFANYNFAPAEESFEKVLNEDESEIYGKEVDDDDEEEEVQMPRGRRGTIVSTEETSRARTDTVSIFQKPNFSNSRGRGGPPLPNRGPGGPGGPPLPQFNRGGAGGPPLPQFNNNNHNNNHNNGPPVPQFNRGGPPVPQFNNHNNNNNNNRGGAGERPLPQFNPNNNGPPVPQFNNNRGGPPPGRFPAPVRGQSLQELPVQENSFAPPQRANSQRIIPPSPGNSFDLNPLPRPEPPQRGGGSQRGSVTLSHSLEGNEKRLTPPRSNDEMPLPQRGGGSQRGSITLSHSIESNEKRLTPPRPNDDLPPPQRAPPPIGQSRSRGSLNFSADPPPRQPSPGDQRGGSRRGGLSQSFDSRRGGMAPNPNNNSEERNPIPPPRGRGGPPNDPNLRGGSSPRGGPPRPNLANPNLLNNAPNAEDFPRPNAKRLSQPRPKLQQPGYTLPPSPDC